MIYTLNVRGVFPVNCYALINEQSQHGFLVDPGAQGEDILAVIHEKHWQIEKILLTHGHFDHTGAVNFLRQNLDIPILIHENGKDYLQNTTLNLSACCGEHILVDDACFVHDGDYIQLADGSLALKVLLPPATPRIRSFTIMLTDTMHWWAIPYSKVLSVPPNIPAAIRPTLPIA